MTTLLKRAIWLVLLIAITTIEAHAQAPYLIVAGDVSTPLIIKSEADFKALPRSSVTVTDATGKQTVYAGVSLADILLKAGVPLKDNIKGADVAKYVSAVSSADGFTALFALPEFDQGTFLVADTADGKPLPTGNGPLQIISPNEKRHSRWVKQLVLIRVGTL